MRHQHHLDGDIRVNVVSFADLLISNTSSLLSLQTGGKTPVTASVVLLVSV